MATEITLIEAMAEIRTILKRVAKKEEFVLTHLMREERLKDPFDDEAGGTSGVLQREIQSIGDLQERMLTIRDLINTANDATELKIGGQTRTISQWLNWRRDVSNARKQFFSAMARKISDHRAASLRNSVTVADVGAGDRKPNDINVYVKESTIAANLDELEEILGTLDGKLTLLNATVKITIPD